MTAIDWMLASIRQCGRIVGFDASPEGPRNALASAADAHRAAFTCGYCGGHEVGCKAGRCAVRKRERSTFGAGGCSEQP